MKLKIEKAGILLEWEFRSEPKGIAFGMYYQRKENGSRSEVSGVRCYGCVWGVVCVCVRCCVSECEALSGCEVLCG